MMMGAISALEYGRPKNALLIYRNVTLIDESVSIDRLIYDFNTKGISKCVFMNFEIACLGLGP